MSRESRSNREGSVSSDVSAESESDTHSAECSICSFESFEYHPDERIHRATFDADVVAPSTAVVGAVSTVADRDPLSIEPLYSTIDPDALNALFADGRRDDGDIHVRFSMIGYRITLSSDGRVTVRPSRADTPQASVDGGE